MADEKNVQNAQINESEQFLIRKEKWKNLQNIVKSMETSDLNCHGQNILLDGINQEYICEISIELQLMNIQMKDGILIHC